MAITENIGGFPEWSEIHRLIQNKSIDGFDILNRIRQNTPHDEAGKGIKAYLEKYDYSIEAVRKYSLRSHKRIQAHSQKNQLRRIYLPAAAVIIGIAALTTWFITNQGPSKNWEDYYQREAGFPVLMGKLSRDDEWMQSFRNREFALSETIIRKQISTVGINDTLCYYLAICLFEQDKTEDALEMLNNKCNSNDKTEILKGFIFWKLGDRLLASSTFTKISRDFPSSESGKLATKIISDHALE